MKIYIVVAALLLGGCGSHYVIPASQTQPAKITTSGYTMSGCLSNLAEQAAKDNCELQNIQHDTSGVILEVFLFPFVKGYTCTADATPRK